MPTPAETAAFVRWCSSWLFGPGIEVTSLRSWGICEDVVIVGFLSKVGATTVVRGGGHKGLRPTLAARTYAVQYQFSMIGIPI
ncbi:hypothetical protein GCM10009762_08400 [Dermacoccus barathri]|uniref:Uncharacterized protein n=1 Tax=Dermacoccus barathri TaxID=322601 RepID=A0ABN2BA86_9MICO